MKDGRNAYDCFRSLAAKLPPVFFTRYDNSCGAALLMPGIPVSCGTLPDIGYRLATVGDSPALVTDLSPGDLADSDRLWLVTLTQLPGTLPRLSAASEEVPRAAFIVVDGHMALVDDRFGDEMRGWALVRLRRRCRRGRPTRTLDSAQSVASCSSQTVTTRCQFYRQYQTADAMLSAAQSYGGLTPP